MAYKIKSKVSGILQNLKKAEKNWELKRKKAQQEKAKYEEIKRKHEAKLQKIYNQEKDKLAKEKEKTDEIERVKQLK